MEIHPCSKCSTDMQCPGVTNCNVFNDYVIKKYMVQAGIGDKKC